MCIRDSPESVATHFGDSLLKNFAQLAAQHSTLPLPAQLPAPPAGGKGHISASAGHAEASASGAVQLQLVWRCMPAAGHIKCLDLMEVTGWTGAHDTFWLDSERTDRARFSIMGGPGGRLWRRITFKLPPSRSAAESASASDSDRTQNVHAPSSIAIDDVGMPGGEHTSEARCPQGVLKEVDAEGRSVEVRCHFRAWLKEYMQRHSLNTGPEQAQLPFDFQGGLVVYLGYEMKAESTGDLMHDSRCALLQLLLCVCASTWQYDPGNACCIKTNERHLCTVSRLAPSHRYACS